MLRGVLRRYAFRGLGSSLRAQFSTIKSRSVIETCWTDASLIGKGVHELAQLQKVLKMGGVCR